MSTAKKVILGIFTILPLVFLLIYLILFFSFFFEMAIQQNQMVHDELPRFLQSFIPMFIIMAIGSVTSIVLMIYYIILISNNKTFDSTQRLMWILIVIFTSTIGQIAYFILEIYPDKQAQASA